MTVPTPREMPCRELVEVLTDYLEGALDAADCARLEAHLAECDDCDQYLTQMRTVLAAARRLGYDGLPAGLQQQLRAVFGNWRTGRL